MSSQPASYGDQRPEFVTLIAVYQFVTAGILLLTSCLIPIVLIPAIFIYIGAAEGVLSGIILATIALALLLSMAVASIAVGWGLLRMREWARLGAIVLAAFALIGFPIWTIVAILVLVYLTSEEARYAFRPQDAPVQITKRTLSATSPDMAPMAAYKAEPPAAQYTSPTQETRPMRYQGVSTGTPGSTNGGTADTIADEETRAIPMPPPTDPAEATEAFYDEEADVSDHYRRWKAALPQEREREETAAPQDEVDETERPSDSTADDVTPEEPLTADEGDLSKRVWGPGETDPWGPVTEQPSADDQTEEPDEDETEDTEDRRRS